MLDLPLGILVSDILKLEKSFQSLKKLSEITLDAQIEKELKQEKIEIPSEILIFIFSHLKINELGTLRNVSKVTLEIQNCHTLAFRNFDSQLQKHSIVSVEEHWLASCHHLY
jgi:hypothetical protein